MPEELPYGVPTHSMGAVSSVAANAFAQAKVNNPTGATGPLVNTTTNPSGATGVPAAATGPARQIIVAPTSSGLIKDRFSNVFQDRLAPTRPAAPAQLAPSAAGASAGNRVLAGGGGIRAGREAYLRGSQAAVDGAMTQQQAITNMILAHMSGILPDQQEEDITPPPTTVGEAKAYS
jgi:hypothetical protein